MTIATSLAQVRPLGGLQGLCAEVLGILNAAVIAEQGTLAYLQQRIRLLEAFVHDREQEEGKIEGEGAHSQTAASFDHATTGTGGVTLASEWNSLPLAGDEQLLPPHQQGLLELPAALCSDRLAQRPSKPVLEARRDVHRRLQPLYDEVFELLAAKTRVLEQLDALLGAYAEHTARLAAHSGLKHTLERAQFVVQPCLLDLLSHRFLDTAQVSSRCMHTRPAPPGLSVA
jgi:hypothetical protein